MNTNHTREAFCPACHHPLSRATADLEHHAPPRSGDVTFCLDCGHALIVTADLELRLPTPTEADQLRRMPDCRKAQSAVHQVIAQRAERSYP